jgi:hypothetical protein
MMSGDVHYAQMYTTNCESDLGYKVTEVCSSGLTHTLRSGWPTIETFCEAHTSLFYKVNFKSELMKILGKWNLYGI